MTIPIKHTWLQTTIHRLDNGSWVDMFTGNPNIIPWSDNHPIANEKYKYARISISFHKDGSMRKLTLSSQKESFGMTALCVSKNPKDYKRTQIQKLPTKNCLQKCR